MEHADLEVKMRHGACGTRVTEVPKDEAVKAISDAGHRDAESWPTLYNCPRCLVYTSDVVGGEDGK